MDRIIKILKEFFIVLFMFCLPISLGYMAVSYYLYDEFFKFLGPDLVGIFISSVGLILWILFFEKWGNNLKPENIKLTWRKKFWNTVNANITALQKEGKSYREANNTFVNWCNENCKSKWVDENGGGVFSFKNQDDAALFKMTWG